MEILGWQKRKERERARETNETEPQRGGKKGKIEKSKAGKQWRQDEVTMSITAVFL